MRRGVFLALAGLALVGPVGGAIGAGLASGEMSPGVAAGLALLIFGTLGLVWLGTRS